MIKKILIANRGEIAVRVIKTARKMGIQTVAVYSEADRNALHVKMADEAILIGPAPSNQSYIVIEKILDAVHRTGADAVHPGYGFLSENAEFADALKKNNITFIGPSAKAIRAMGDKIASKKIAREAGVSTVPGHMDIIADAAHAARIAREIGYPVMIKASAGGGGKGMRVARNDAEAKEGFELSRSEAKTSFGDDRIFIEKFVTEPHHIEIQVLGDNHGTCVYLGERECSIQRRNQKVIEEAPSPFIDAKTRKAMGEQAVALAKAVGYVSAGTVEFIVDGQRNFYFLEMNTRLQVEHPVTELVTGFDIVEKMIRVANGEKLGIAQSDITHNGWAVEARVYAEDPARGFLPSIGRLARYRPPVEGMARNGSIVRVDAGVFEGGEISIYYDPMIAKLCTWAPSRDGAIDAMSRALDEFEIEGIGNNLAFLSAVMGHQRFKSGSFTTAFIADEYPDGFKGVEMTEADKTLLAQIAVVAHVTAEDRARNISGVMENHHRRLGSNWVAAANDFRKEFKVDRHGNVFKLAATSGKTVVVTSDWKPGASIGRFDVDGTTHAAKIKASPKGTRVRLRGQDLTLKVRNPRISELATLMPVKAPRDTSKQLLCPMPGLLKSLGVTVGDKVDIGQTLAVVEAMKMENVLRAERKGVVKRMAASVGQSLSVDELIMEFE